MNFINRLLLIVELMLAIALVPISLFLFLFNRAGLADSITSVGRALASGPDVALAQVACVGSAMLLFIVAIILLFLELRSSSRRLRVQQVTDGHVEITDDAIIQRLEHSVSQIADVIDVHPRVSANKNNSVDVQVELETSPEVNVPKKTQEVIAIVKQVMEEQMGLQVGKIHVQLDYARTQTKPKGP